MIIQMLSFRAIGYRTLMLDFGAGRLPAANFPDWTQVATDGAGSTGLYQYAFDKTTDQSIFVNFHMPIEWAAGTTIYPHVHWAPATNGTQDQKVSWGMEYVITEEGAVMGNSTMIYGDTPEDWSAGDSLVAKQHYVTKIGSGIDMSASATGATILVRFFRDASGNGGTDDLDNDAYADELHVQYYSNTRAAAMDDYL